MDRKEAIEVVRKKVDYYEADKRLKAALEALIPELAESEDERTLEFMCDHFYNLVKLQDENETMYAKCLVFVTALKGQKAIQDSVAVVITNRPTISKFEAGKAAVLNNPEKYGLCKPAEWSEEDERIRKNICRIVKEHMRHCAEVGIGIGDHREALQYLEKQGEHQSAEWSDDDEKQLNWFYRLLDFIGKEFPSSWGKNHKGGKEWLKSRRPQPNNNLRWRRATEGSNLPESIILPDGEEPRFGKCAVRDSYYIPISELKELPKE